MRWPGEHHTRQGEPRRAVSEVRGIGEYEPRDWPARKSLRGGSKQNLPTIAAPGCWCGQSFGHDWPGKADDQPHPREAETWQDAARRLPGGRS